MYQTVNGPFPAVLLIPALLLSGLAPAGGRQHGERSAPDRPAIPSEAREFLRSGGRGPSGWDYREIDLEGAQGRTLPLAVWPRGGPGTGRELRILLLAGQHGDEPSGSDALLKLLGELAAGLHPEWRGRIRLFVVPMVNEWGLDRGVRNTAAGIDLNRDHLRLKAPESFALHRLIAGEAPHAAIDLHEKPEPCRHVEVARATHPSEDPRRRSLARLVVEGAGRALDRRGIPSHPFFTRSFSVEPGSSPPRLAVFHHPALPDPSDSLNSIALSGAVAFFVETAAGDPGTPYSETVAVQHAALTALVVELLARAEAVRAAVDGGRAAPLRPWVALQMRQGESPLDPVGEFTPCAGPADGRTGVRPWMPRVEVTLKRTRPAAYLLPARFGPAARVLAGHGAVLYLVKREMEAEGEVGRIVGESSPAPEYRSRPLVAADFTLRTVKVRAGDWVVTVGPPLWDLVPVLLEPESQFGLGSDDGLGLLPKLGDKYPVIRLVSLPPMDRLTRWTPESREWNAEEK